MKHRRRHADIVRGSGRWVERLCPKCGEWKHQATHYYQRENGQRESICRACQLIKRRAYYVAHHDGAKTYTKHPRLPTDPTPEQEPQQPCALAAALGYGQLYNSAK